MCVCVCLCTKLQVFSIALTSFRQGDGNFTLLPPTSKQALKQPTQIRINIKIQFVNKKKILLLAFLFITIALLIAVSLYCYMIKCKTKQKHLLPYHVKNNKLTKLCINKGNINMRVMVN